MADSDDLYRELGRKIRQARERSGERSEEKLSQEALAQRLGLSRASMVNIEAGRQRAPLHLLWQIAELLGTDLTMLIPNREEMLATSNRVELEKAMMKQIEDFATGDAGRIKRLAAFASKLNATTIDPARPERKSHEHRKPRS